MNDEKALPEIEKLDYTQDFFRSIRKPFKLSVEPLILVHLGPKIDPILYFYPYPDDPKSEFYYKFDSWMVDFTIKQAWAKKEEGTVTLFIFLEIEDEGKIFHKLIKFVSGQGTFRSEATLSGMEYSGATMENVGNQMCISHNSQILHIMPIDDNVGVIFD